MANLLVLAEPGARCGFIGNWLFGSLKQAHYDVGESLGTYNFTKKHYDGDGEFLFTDVDRHYYAVAIVSDIDSLDLLLKLFYDKCIYGDAAIDMNEVLVILLSTAERYMENAKNLDTSQFDDVITFSDTFNQERLNEIYYKFNDRLPTAQEIKIAEETNKINTFELDEDHPCTVIKDLIKFDMQMYPKQRIFNAWEYCDNIKHLAELRTMLDPQHYF